MSTHNSNTALMQSAGPVLADTVHPGGIATSEMPWVDAGDRASAGINLVSLWHSLRRCWPQALGLGLILSTLTGALLWYLLPTMYTAEALLEVRRAGQEWNGQIRPESDKAYEVYRDTQANLIRTTWIIGMALRSEPKIQNFYILRNEKNKEAWISENIKARPLGEGQILQLLLRGERVSEVKQLLDAVIASYMQHVIQEEVGEHGKRFAKFSQAVSDHQSRLEKLQESYFEKCEALEIPPNRHLHQAKFDMLRGTLARIDNDLAGIKRSKVDLDARILDAKQRLTMGISQIDENLIIDEMERYPEYRDLVEQRTEIRDELERNQRQFPAGAERYQRELARIDQKIKDLQKKLRPQVVARLRSERGDSPQEIEQNLRSSMVISQDYDRKIAELVGQRQAAEAQFELLNASNAELAQMDKDIEQQTKVYQELQAELSHLRIEKDEPPRVQQKTRAEIREESPLLLKVFEVVAASGLIFGLTVAGVAFLDYQTRRVNSASDFAATSDIRLLGTLPLIHHTNLISFRHRDPQTLELILRQSIDSIRASVRYNRLVGNVKVVMVTSATEQEGRTTLASQLAISMARSGKKTLLIDADVMSPQQHVVFQLSGDRGLCDVVNGSHTPLADVILPTVVSQLWLLPAGPFAGDVQFSGPEAEAMFAELRQQFDMIVIETGPVLSGAEAQLLGQYADTAVLSVRRDESRLPRIESACERLRAVGITILGAVLHGDSSELRRTSNGSVIVAHQIEDHHGPSEPAEPSGHSFAPDVQPAEGSSLAASNPNQREAPPSLELPAAARDLNVDLGKIGDPAHGYPSFRDQLDDFDRPDGDGDADRHS